MFYYASAPLKHHLQNPSGILQIMFFVLAFGLTEWFRHFITAILHNVAHIIIQQKSFIIVFWFFCLIIIHIM